MGGIKRALFAGSTGFLVAGAAMAADAPAIDQQRTEVESVTVTGIRPGEPASLKTDIPPLETARAISVITAQTLQEQGITRLADALRNVAGVSRSSTYGYFDAFQIRGYDAAYGSIFLDGLTSGNVAGAVNELAGLEQVEVVKGPASVLFGASPLGGVVNLVSKRPKAEPLLDVGVATGSYDLREITVDANHALTKDGSLLGRVNLVYRDADAFVKNSHSQRIYIAPALTWKIGADTRLTLLGRYQRDYDSPWSPLSAWGTILPSAHGPLPLDFDVNSRGAERAINNLNAKQIGYVFDHRFSDTFKFSQTVRYEKRQTYWNRWMFVAGFMDDNVVDGVQQGHVLGRYLYGPFFETDKEFGADSRLTATFNTGAIGHKVLAGLDYHRMRNVNAGVGNYNPSDNALDILNPDYDAPHVPNTDALSPTKGKTSQLGFYLHDHITIGEHLTLTVGGRWDQAKSGGQEDKKFSPSAGATWSLTPGASLYANYSKSFTPTPSWQTTFDGSLLPPETGQNIEAGLKVRTEDGMLSGSIAAYQLTRQNVATDDPDHLFFYVVTGEQRSRGVEVEGAWRPTTAVVVTAAYAHINAKVTKDNTLPVGLPLANFPENSLNLWGKYTVQEGIFARLGMSLGLLYNSDKHLYEGQLYTLPSYTLLNAGLSYDLGPWDLNLTADNLTDKRYFPDACCLDRITPGAPRNWRLSLRRSF
ncbi:TonB-dependent siderophore receptor [Caulobacter sp. FWC2]|uniref:TonB-dependent siderophore receptor n=1 Tax=Caulobacter sp. FWC2 TaxID=69664 RepID=UPI000C15E5D2|nr:TonB-dependent siderophore receptor [Caulobacter sp. FWC2]PIB91582.1 TonB-dependent siderophore receptor [Caulobacter sp. FWC2]